MTRIPTRGWRQWSTIDKTTWGDGPWMNEPDKAVWIDEDTGLDCMIHRGPTTGALCGYVGVGPGHPWFGRSTEDVDAEVHGGLNYAAPCQEDATEDNGICHVAADGQPTEVWWFGFDCGHYMDTMPAMEARWAELAATMPAQFPELPQPPWATYKPLGYVVAEVEHLARQVANAGR